MFIIRDSLNNYPNKVIIYSINVSYSYTFYKQLLEKKQNEQPRRKKINVSEQTIQVKLQIANEHLKDSSTIFIIE